MSNTLKLIEDNYITLFNDYTKKKNKYTLVDSRNCEDNFEDKILQLMESDIDQTLETIRMFISTPVKRERLVQTVLFNDEIDVPDTTTEDNVLNIQLLFIDYRKK